MNKNLLIGIPVAIVAIVAIILVTKSPSTVAPITNNEVVGLQTQGAPLDTQDTVEDTSSVDSIVASFNKDAESDAAMALTESEETTALMLDLQDYNNIKTSTYETL